MITFFFFNDTATTEIYTLSLHDALPIYPSGTAPRVDAGHDLRGHELQLVHPRSEEHTSELQSQSNIVCRLLLEKKSKGSRRGGQWPTQRTLTTRTTNSNQMSRPSPRLSD